MKKSKLLKSLGFASLAVFMGATALFAFAPLNNTPIAAGGLNASANTENQTFDIGLRPDTDPVVYVTESGLEIKKSNDKYTSTTTTTTNTGYTYTQDLTSFYYFTMGSFTGTVYTAKNQTDKYEVSNEPVNWLILGRGSGFEFSDNTPAGTSIKSDNPKQEFAIAPGGYLPMNMQSIPEGPDGEIPDRCFLVISEKLLGQMYFNSSGSTLSGPGTYYSIDYNLYSASGDNLGNRYRFIGSVDTATTGRQSWNTTSNAGGSLYNYINNLFSKNNSTGAIEGQNNLGFTKAEADLVVPQQLYTYYSNGPGYPLAETPETDNGTYYTMFPRGYRAIDPNTKQNFCMDDYLLNPNQRVASLIKSTQASSYYLRTGTLRYADAPYIMHPDGSYRNECSPCYYLGVRPAFVLKIMD